MPIDRELPTDERIKRAAIRLFGTKGFAATGIREIAHEAGISVASLYHYMATKEDLLLSLMLEGMDSLLVPANELLGSATSPTERLRALIGIHVNFHCERSALARVSDTEFRALEGEALQRILRLRDEYQELWRATVISGMDLGLFQVAEPNLAMFGLLEMLTGISHWYSPAGEYSVAQITNFYAALCLRMLGYDALGLVRELEEQSELPSQEIDPALE